MRSDEGFVDIYDVDQYITNQYHIRVSQLCGIDKDFIPDRIKGQDLMFSKVESKWVQGQIENFIEKQNFQIRLEDKIYLPDTNEIVEKSELLDRITLRRIKIT